MSAFETRLLVALLWLSMCVLAQHNKRTREIAAIGTAILLALVWLDS